MPRKVPVTLNTKRFLTRKSTASPARSEVDRTRSPSPTTQPVLNMPKPRRIAANTREESTPRSEMEKNQAPARLIIKAGKHGRELGSSSPVPPGAGHNAPNTAAPQTRRARPETSHQRAVNMNRRMRIDKILHKKLVAARGEVLKRRKKLSSTSIYLAMTRIFDLPNDYDTEEEYSWGPGGLVPHPMEEQDYGGEAMQRKKVLDRAMRRLAREDRDGPLKQLSRSLEPRKQKATNGGHDERHEERGRKLSRTRSKSRLGRGLHTMNPGDSQGEALDDLDLDLLGEGRPGAEYDSNDESGVDYSEGGGDATEDEMMEDSYVSLAGR